MRRGGYWKATLIALLCGVTLVFTIAGQTGSAKHAFTPDAVPYGPAPAFVPAGSQLAVLEGNPGATSGDYTVRLKMPDGYRISPHWHPKRENDSTRAKWENFQPVVSLISTQICIITRWQAEKSSCKCMEHLRYSSTMSILTTTQAGKSSSKARAG